MSDKKRVLVGMSGGVDSSAAALLLIQNGYEVCGCTMRLHSISAHKNGSDEDDAKSVCQKLGIEHITLDLTDEFAKHVMKPFADGYIRGETPNPCIDCNKHMKFGLMLDKAEELGFDYIATGHYADTEYSEQKGRWLLKRPYDRKKDQTYVLYNMTQHQLEHTLFPLFGLDKAEIRRLAEENGLITSRKSDSQDICFIPDKDYVAFIKRYTGYAPQTGNYIDTDGKIIGQHSGYIHYTIGQRKGLGAAFGKPVFVTEKDPLSNTVTLAESCKKAKSLMLRDVNLIYTDNLSEPMKVSAKIRYNAKEQEAVIYPTNENGLLKIEFDQYAENAASGQSCVFYTDDHVVGGGIII